MRSGGYNRPVTRTITVAGGGLSGLSVAVLLSRLGLPVEISERKENAGGRFAGGWQVIENGSADRDALVELAALGFPPDIPVRPARRALFLDHRGGVFEVSSSEPFAYFVRRGAGADTLDGWLAAHAENTGATRRRRGGGGEDADVVATGPRCADGVAREVVFASDLDDTVAVLFDPNVTPTGYAYLFCIEGHATFGVAQVRRTAQLRRAQAEAWRRFREVLGPFAVRVLHQGGQYMNFSIPAHLRDGGGRWHVGEAAGVQDFLFGLGNRLAMRSAALAVAGMRGEWDPLRFEAELLRPMRASVALRFLYETMGRRGLQAFCRAAAATDFRTLLIGLQRPRRATRAVSAVVRQLWRERGGCRHGALCTWCRRRER